VLYTYVIIEIFVPWTHVASVRKKEVWFGNLKGRNNSEDRGYRWEDNIKVDLKQ
jgi:hypothetical protein